MKRRGQITLETAVLILLAINIFLYVTIPTSNVARVASEAIGTAALAEKASASIADTANFVGISGLGAKKAISLYIPRDFTKLECSSTQVKVWFNQSSKTNVSSLPGAFGVKSDVGPIEERSSTAHVDSFYSLACDVSYPWGQNGKLYLCFNNTKQGVKVTNCGMTSCGYAC